MDSNIFNGKRIHLVGVKGVGMTALACALFDIGAKLSGSDVGESFITQNALDELKILINNSFSENNISKEIDLVIFSGAHRGAQNIEVVKARQLSIPTLNYAQALAKLFENKKIIAVAGTHGKTTTTAMIAAILNEANTDPSWIIGAGSVLTLQKPGRFGQGEWAVLEADEYIDQKNGKAKFLHINPFITVITSLEWDHPDVYKTHKEYINVFKKLLKRTNPKGIAVLNGEDKNLRIMSKGFQGRVKFILRQKPWHNLKLQIHGDYNRVNATFAAHATHEIGISQEIILRALSNFKGLKRRFEYRGKTEGWKIYDDYAHLPTEIRAVLGACRELYPHSNILAVFQSHTLSRTKQYQEDFAKSFDNADTVLVAPIFASAREIDSGQSIKINEGLIKAHKRAELIYSKSELKEKMKKYFVERKENILITIGAGDIYKWITPDKPANVLRDTYKRCIYYYG